MVPRIVIINSYYFWSQWCLQSIVSSHAFQFLVKLLVMGPIYKLVPSGSWSCPRFRTRDWDKFPSFWISDFQGGLFRAANSLGVRYLRLLWGRWELSSSHQSSIFLLASSRLKNQCWFRHSCRNRLMKLSMNALSVGFPGLEKSSVILCA